MQTTDSDPSPVEQWLEQTSLSDFRRAVSRWYRKNARSLPWRDHPDPYAVWVSEIMLQQTQVATVLNYFDRFIERFPTVQALASAAEEEVLRYWQGLGYYRRARNLHRACQQVAESSEGVVPQDPDELRKLPGLGRYTANAILCFSQDQRLPILEANTFRLWTRLCAASGDPVKSPLNRRLWQLAEQALPRKNSSDFNQALMDLGATVCTSKNPNCPACPLRKFCRSFEAGNPEQYPQKAAPPPIQELESVAVVIWAHDRVLVQRRPADGRWGGLWEFPNQEKADCHQSWGQCIDGLLEQIPEAKEFCTTAGERLSFTHGIMHYRIRLKCFDVLSEHTFPPGHSQGRWVSVDQLKTLPFSLPHARIAHSVQHSTQVQRTLFGES